MASFEAPVPPRTVPPPFAVVGLGQGSEPPLRDCTITLVPTLSCTAPCQTPGGSIWFRQKEDGGLAIAAATVYLPPPSVFDPSFDQYLLATDPDLFPPRILTLTFGGLGFWTEVREQGYGAPIPPYLKVSVAPGLQGQPVGPVLLQGEFRDCR